MATDKSVLGMYRHISDLEKQIDEKDAMIDWLVNELTSNTGLIPMKDWRKEAQEAVKKCNE